LTTGENRLRFGNLKLETDVLIQAVKIGGQNFCPLNRERRVGSNRFLAVTRRLFFEN
jgi:hypothetical protein